MCRWLRDDLGRRVSWNTTGPKGHAAAQHGRKYEVSLSHGKAPLLLAAPVWL
jgi:hypothetical protein